MYARSSQLEETRFPDRPFATGMSKVYFTLTTDVLHVFFTIRKTDDRTPGFVKKSRAGHRNTYLRDCKENQKVCNNVRHKL